MKMVYVNLMPWREKRRKEREKQFYTMLGASAMFAAVVVFGLMTWQSSLTQAQKDRNELLEEEIAVLEAQIEEIQELDLQRDRLLGRKQVIEQLQSNRSQMVHLFDEIARSAPEGMFINNITQTNNKIVIEGRSESSSRTADYLTRLEGLNWMIRPDLSVIEEQIERNASIEDVGYLPYMFKVELTLNNPNAPVEDVTTPEASGTTSARAARDARRNRGQ